MYKYSNIVYSQYKRTQPRKLDKKEKPLSLQLTGNPIKHYNGHVI